MSATQPIAFASLAALLLTACTPAEPAPPPPSTGRFEGIPIPGKLADAKAGGFTNCDENFVCKAALPLQIAGLTALDAEVHLQYRDWSDAFGQDLPPEQHVPANLAYGSITYDFGPYKFVSGCPNPAIEPCLDPKEGMGILVTALSKAGWLVESSRGGWRAFKPGVPASINGSSRTNQVTVYPESPESVAGYIEAIHEERAHYAKIDADQKAVQDYMK